METTLQPLNPSPSPSPSTAINDDSTSSSPYVSAPSSPGHSTSSYFPSGFFYSAPTSPMHFVLSKAPARSNGGLIPTISDASSNGSFEFEFSGRFDSPAPEIGADELFLNGQIRPMKLCAHLQRPQNIPPLTLLESDERENENDDRRHGRSFRLLEKKSRSERRRTRSLSPLRNTTPFDWFQNDGVSKDERENNNEGEESVKEKEDETTSSGRSSTKRWLFLKDFLRSKSEGRSIFKGFSQVKERREKVETASYSEEKKVKKKEGGGNGGDVAAKKVAGKRMSAHELHYAVNRAQAEEMRKKTYLPYWQGLLGCLGFNSKSYGAINGFARALNPVSSR